MDEITFHQLVQEYLDRCEEVQDCKDELKSLDEARKEIPSTDVSESFTELKTNLDSVELLEKMAGGTRLAIDKRKERALQRIREIPNEIAKDLPANKWIKHERLAVCVKEHSGEPVYKKIPTRMGKDSRGNRWVRFEEEVLIDGGCRYTLEFNDWERVVKRKAPESAEVEKRRRNEARPVTMLSVGASTVSIFLFLGVTFWGFSPVFYLLMAACSFMGIVWGMTRYEILTGKRDAERELEEKRQKEADEERIERMLR